MRAPLISSKLQVPRLRPARLRRAHLLARLEAAQDRPLILLSAPAGFGKTTLLADWLAGGQRPYAWLGLDEGDNDPARFLAYLVSALQQIEDEVGRAILPLVADPASPPRLPRLLPVLVNEINAIPEEFVLVLDDYHLIDSPPVHRALAFLVDHMPQPLHLAVATRADPPLPLARLRARGQLLELRQADLRFQPEEAAGLFRQALGTELTADQVTLLTERAEGWAAGLQLAALALQEDLGPGEPGPAQAEAFIHAFRGTQRHVLDYLVEEVLDRQSPLVQEFLVRTSILERLCGPLCDALQAGSDPTPCPEGEGRAAAEVGAGQQMLEHLERSNLFITPLDDHREWYRYHQLFAELLRQRLHSGPDSQNSRLGHADPAELHRRAASWFETRGMLAEAIHHRLEAGEAEAAAGLLELAASSLWRQGELTTLLRWLERLPDPVLGAHPRLCAVAAVVTLIRGDSLERVEQLAHRASASSLDDRPEGELAVVAALLAMYRGDLERGLASAELARRRLPSDSVFRGLANRTSSGLQLLQGDLPSAERLLEEDVRNAEAADDRLGASASLRRLGSLALYRGRLRRARDYYLRALERSRDAGGQLWPLAGRVLTHLAEIDLERNDLRAAARQVEEALALLGSLIPGWSVGSYLTLGQVRQAMGDPAGARAALDTARRLAQATETPLDDAYLRIQAASLAVAQHDLPEAERWVDHRTSSPARFSGSPPSDIEGFLQSRIFQELEQTTLARVRLAQKRPRQALIAVEPFLARADKQPWMGNRVPLLVIRALAYQDLGMPEAALADLQAALGLAEPEGFVRTFLDGGEPLARLLEAASEHGPASAYATRLLVAYRQAGSPEAAGHPRLPEGTVRPDGLVEPLTERERQVLRLLGSSLTTPEIAAELGVAASTVRTFVKHLYGKLGVHRRLEAIEKGRELDLLRLAPTSGGSQKAC